MSSADTPYLLFKWNSPYPSGGWFHLTPSFHQRIAICLVLRWSPYTIVRCHTRHLSTRTRHLSDKYHIYTRHVPYTQKTYTVPYVHQMFTRHIPYIHQISVRCIVYVWCKCGTCLTDVWLESTGVWWGIWQLSDKKHLSMSTWTNSNCLAEAVK